MINAKKKGNAGENKFANWMVANGLRAWKDAASGGGSNEKGDVGNDLNLHLEIKTVKAINLHSVWRKAELESSKTHNTPTLAIHFDGMPENSWLMVMHSDAWLELMTKESGVKNDYVDPKLRWAIKNLIDACKKVLKYLTNDKDNSTQW